MKIARLGSIAKYALLLLLMTFTLLPFAWLVDSSFKDPATLFKGDPTWMIQKFSLSGYQWIINPERGNLLRPLANSLIVSFFSVLSTMFFAITAGYAIGRYKFPGLPIFLGLLFMAQIFQGPIIMIPWYKMAAFMKLVDTKTVLVLIYGTITIPMTTVMMSGFFKSVPTELEEAAYIDGCTKAGTLVKIVLPMMLPGIVAVAILSFIFSWNDYQYALILTSSLKSKTVQILINDLVQAVGSINWTGLLAAGVIATMPVVVLFAVIQRYLVEGLTAGAVKG
ncbi:MAG: carbohydrate ABC transporter permease [Treponemataceae bacterium]